MAIAVVVDGRAVAVRGRVVELLKLVLEHQDEINRVPAGSLELHFGSPGGQVSARLVTTLRRALARA